MGALKSALTGSQRLVAMVAVISAIAFALFMCVGVGNVSAEEVYLEVPDSYAADANNTTATADWFTTYLGMNALQLIVSALAVICLVAFIIMKDFRILIVCAFFAILAVVAYYLV